MADPTFKIPKDIINPIIQAHVNEALLRALDGPDKIVTAAILQCLNISVDDQGKPTTYRGVPWIEWVIGESVRNAAKAAIVEQLAKHGDKLKATLARQMSMKNSPMVKQLVEGMVGAMTTPDTLKWRINVSYDKPRE